MAAATGTGVADKVAAHISTVQSRLKSARAVL
jgi:hypothetical protein